MLFSFLFQPADWVIPRILLVLVEECEGTGEKHKTVHLQGCLSSGHFCEGPELARESRSRYNVGLRDMTRPLT